MARPRKEGTGDYPRNMYRDERGGFRVVNPLSSKSLRIADETTARAVAQQFNELRFLQEKQVVERFGRATVTEVVQMYLTEVAPHKAWKRGTRANHLYKLNRFKAKFSDELFALVDCVMIDEWMQTLHLGASIWNKYRYTLSLLWELAISKNLIKENEPLKILEKTTSKKLAANRTKRRPLDLAGYDAIYKEAPAYLRLAMDLSLLTLQSRNEVINMQHSDFIDGFLRVIRDKTSYVSDMAFIKIRVTEELKYFRQRARMLNNAASPYLVHRKPFRKVERAPKEGEITPPHWTWVTPNFLSKAFKKARDATGLWAELPPKERPGFHMIRKLGAKLAKARGVPTEAIQALMTHSDPKTTAIYTERGEAALTDADYVSVAPLFTLKELGR